MRLRYGSLTATLFGVLFLAAPLLWAGADTPRAVAVLVQPGFVPYGGTPSLPPPRIVEALEEASVPVVPLTASEAADPARLNTKRVVALVLPYGNAFPEPAYANIRAFHAAGGCLILTGIPFCHPCVPVDGGWKDLGHDGSRFGHDALGIGTCGFAGPEEGVDRLTVDPRNPLGLEESALPRNRASLQWMATSDLPPADHVMPLILVKGPRKNAHVAAGIIEHGCPQFHGALDVWIGQTASNMDARDAYAARQIITRAALWILARRGVLPHAVFSRQMARLRKLRRPGGLPEGLAFHPTPRPWGDTFLPKSSPPAKVLLAVDVRHLPDDVRIALTCLQGLTSRRQPQIWLIRSDEDQWWLDWARQKGYISGYTPVSDWKTLFRQFAWAFRGAVIPDDRLYRSNLLAVDVAACEDLIIASPRVAQELNLPIRRDLRGRFRTYAEGLEWVWRTYRNRLNRYLCNYMHPARLSNCVFAYDLQWRGIVFWPAGPVDAQEPGADPVAERDLVARIMAWMAPNVAVLGFPYAGEGVGLGEGEGVSLASRYAKGLVCSDFLGNTSVTSGFRIRRLRQPAQPPPPPLEKNKVYIALVLSDGDNENTWLGFFKAYFQHPAFGTFPLAFGMGPPIREILPHVAQWYFEHAKPTTEFIADVSGAAYIQPDAYAKAYREPSAVWKGFFDWTSRLMQDMDMRSVRTVGGGDALLQMYSRALPFCHSLFADMGRYSGRSSIENLTYALPDGMPVFRAVTSWRYGKGGFLREVREQVGAKRPAFVNGFVHCWTFNMDDLAAIYRQRDPDMVFVTPTQLARLYREARLRGWVR
ncbi:MAG: GxGYxYP domain-containing protein [Chthonomonadales bacterium]